MHPSLNRTAIATFILVLALAGMSCASVPPTNYYVLGFSGNPKSLVRESVFPYSLAVSSFDSAPIYLRKKIIWRSESNQVGYYSYEKWAETPAEMFSFRLYERAYESNLFDRVIMSSTSEDADFILRGTILSFEELNTAEGVFGKVEVEAEILRADGTPMWSGVLGYVEPAGGEGVRKTVQAIAVAAEKTITALLSSVEDTVRTIHGEGQTEVPGGASSSTNSADGQSL